MKRIICLIISVVMIMSLAACAGGNTAATEAADSSAADTPADENTADAAFADGVDIDLTSMSSTMVYSEVLNMQQTPEKYLGKTVRMRGPFNVTETADNRYFACVIADAAACCATGIEFVWAGDHSYPEDYPDPETEITVTGTFNTYKEGNSSYLQLKDADVQF